MKFLAVSATVLTGISMASASFADDTKRADDTKTMTSTSSTTNDTSTSYGASGSTSAAPATTGVGASQSSGSTTSVTTPSNPPTTATQTTQTTLDANGTMSPTVPSTSVPTSTTTVTQAEISPPPVAPRDTTTVYQKNRPNTALLVTGGALLLSTYVTTAAVHAGNGREGGVDDHLYIPVAGPWINLGQSSHETRDDVLIVGSGILQGVGTGLLISSFFVPEKVEAAKITAGPVKMNVTPTTYAGGAGLGAVGTF